MFGRDSKRQVDILIGKTARIRGDIDFSGGLHLDGRVAGHVRADRDADSTLSISERGWIEGSAEATNVILNGTVRGDIRATGHVALGRRAKVYGDVYYGVIETALGAEILGRLVPIRGAEGDGVADGGDGVTNGAVSNEGRAVSSESDAAA